MHLGSGQAVRAIATIAVAGGIAALAAAAPANAAPTEFRVPDAKVKFLTKACEPFAWPVGTVESSIRLRPAGIGENGARTEIALHFPRYWAERYLRNAPNVGSGFRAYEGGGLATNFFLFSQPTQIKFELTDIKTGGPLTGSTKRLRAKIQFRDFDGLPGCRVSINAKLTKQ